MCARSAAGRIAAVSAAVALLGEVTVPDLKGDTGAQATGVLTAVGLVGHVEHTAQCLDPGHEIGQRPDAGTSVAPSSTVTFTGVHRLRERPVQGERVRRHLEHLGEVLEGMVRHDELLQLVLQRPRLGFGRADDRDQAGQDLDLVGVAAQPTGANGSLSGSRHAAS